MTLTRDQKVAFAEFQLKEKLRHLDDIRQIEETLRELAAQGIIPEGPAAWVSVEDIRGPDKVTNPNLTVDFVVNNQSPLGGYYRLQSKKYENTTEVQFDGTGIA